MVSGKLGAIHCGNSFAPGCGGCHGGQLGVGGGVLDQRGGIGRKGFF